MMTFSENTWMGGSNGVPSHEAYLEKVGAASLRGIQANPVLGYAPGLERK
jgi:hypothetical protein